ncbi:MAG: hypothetical protein HXX11_22795 [Desulfuromonadales bacterium]|nr:hypothetical protein [Desulfuromonadales bacterium]
MKTLLLFGLLMLPSTVLAEDCKVVEFPDHFEVTCIGDAKPIQVPKQMIAPTASPAAQSAPAQPQSQATEQQNATQQADAPAAAKAADTPKTPAPGGIYVKKEGRQGRPSAADMNAAIEARRKLIQDSRPKDQPVAP